MISKILPLLLVCFISVFSIYCVGSFNKGKIIDSKPPSINKNALSNSSLAGSILKFNSALVAYNTKKEYEVGKKIAQIIRAKKSISKVPALIALKYDQKSLATCPADNLKIETHVEALDIFKNIMKTGWHGEKEKLKTKDLDVRNTVLSLAIKKENIDIVKKYVKEKIMKIEAHNYDFAVEIALTSKTEMADSIVDYLSTSCPHLGYQPSATKKLNLGFALYPVLDAIQKNNFPVLRKALNEGLEPNTQISGYGSLLCFSVIAQCAKCVEFIVKKEAEINTHIKMKSKLQLEATKQTLSVNGWTPLMVAVGNGQLRIIEILLSTGEAEVSRASLFDKIHHARFVARDIEDEKLRIQILDTLTPGLVESFRLAEFTKGKDFAAAVIAGNYKIVDAFLLRKPELSVKLPIKINVKSQNIDRKITKLLSDEDIELN